MKNSREKVRSHGCQGSDLKYQPQGVVGAAWANAIALHSTSSRVMVTMVIMVSCAFLLFKWSVVFCLRAYSIMVCADVSSYFVRFVQFFALFNLFLKVMTGQKRFYGSFDDSVVPESACLLIHRCHVAFIIRLY